MSFFTIFQNIHHLISSSICHSVSLIYKFLYKMQEPEYSQSFTAVWSLLLLSKCTTQATSSYEWRFENHLVPTQDCNRDDQKCPIWNASIALEFFKHCPVKTQHQMSAYCDFVLNGLLKFLYTFVVVLSILILHYNMYYFAL